MIGVVALVDAVGPALWRVVVAGDGSEVDDLTLAELDDGVVGVPGDLVLGVGIAHPQRGIGLLEQVALAGAGGVVLRAPLAGDVDVAAAAQRLGVALIELRAHASWAHLVWLLRGTFDRVTGAPLDDAGVHGDLFALADAAATILDAPVTIEDAQSRVLAYSGRQEPTDPARLSTIVGRRVPEPIVAHFRARGVFRRLTRSAAP
ncbi:MAG: PucR family transcriptional regulator, partial [Pseudonocardia sp.]|nr:PucR family transcriptional regulator [Pseudonocardia sp.]